MVPKAVLALGGGIMLGIFSAVIDSTAVPLALGVGPWGEAHQAFPTLRGRRLWRGQISAVLNPGAITENVKYCHVVAAQLRNA